MEDERCGEGGKPVQRRAFSFDDSEVIPISPRPPMLALKATPEGGWEAFTTPDQALADLRSLLDARAAARAEMIAAALPQVEQGEAQLPGSDSLEARLDRLETIVQALVRLCSL